MRKLTLAIDFDGTICSNRYPDVGVLMDGAEIIREWYKHHTIVISTCRIDAHLEACKAFLAANDIPYHYINENVPELIKMYNGDCRKISCDVQIDDKNAGGFLGWKQIINYVKKLESQLPIIVCIVGESGSGKSTLAKKLERTFGHTLIHSLTDRPSRGEGDDHLFLTPEEFDLISPEEMIAQTTFGGYRYCCRKQDVKRINTYIISEDGLANLRERFSDIYDIRTIRVTCPEKERVNRVGQERVARDSGRFTFPNGYFDVILRTDREYNVYSLSDIVN